MNLLFETKYALRLLRLSPGYTATCVLVTAVGMAVSLVVFTIVYNMSYKPLQYAGSDYWYNMMFTNEDGLSSNTDAFWFQQLAGLDPINFSVVGRLYSDSSAVEIDNVSRRVPTGIISPSLLSASKVTPLLGRLFQDEDANTDSAPTAVLSYQAWQVYYDADPNIVGKTSQINGEAHTIIGVLPNGFNLGFAQDIYLPYKPQLLTEPELLGNGNPVIALPNHSYKEAATLELNQLFSRIKEQFPDAYQNRSGIIINRANEIGSGSGPIYALMAIISVLLILFSCLNTGSLLFANTIKRRQEYSIRNALGSSTIQLLKQSLLESLFICGLGTVLGLLITKLVLLQVSSITSTLFSSGGVNGEFHYQFGMGLPTIICAFGVLVIMWLLSGLIPVFKAVKRVTKTGTSDATKSTAYANKGRAVSALSGVQIVISCFLLIVSAVMVAALNFASNRDLGIEKNSLITAHIPMDEQYTAPNDQLNYLDILEAELLSSPSIESAGIASSLPSMEFIQQRYQVEDQLIGSDDLPMNPLASVSEHYFSTMGINIIEGRNFRRIDNSQSLPVAIVDESFVQRYWPNESAIGKRIQINPQESNEWLTIIGVSSHVLGNIRYSADTASLIYRPIYQDLPRNFRLVVRYKGEYNNAIAAINRAATAANRDMPLAFTTSLSQYYLTQNAMSYLVMMSRLFLYVALSTGLLALVGIFAVFARNMILRSREFGIRQSLGADKRNILWLHLKKGLLFSSTGCCIGTFLALLVMGAISNFQSLTIDSDISIPLIVTGVFVSLFCCILLASYLPARQSIKREPGDALRYE